MSVKAEIERRLRDVFSPVRLEVIDESDRHLGHAGHDGRGESHFRVVIEAAAFAGLSRLDRQRRVYAALGDLMSGRIHALALAVSAPGEAAKT